MQSRPQTRHSYADTLAMSRFEEHDITEFLQTGLKAIGGGDRVVVAAFHDYVIHGRNGAINPAKSGTRQRYMLHIPALSAQIFAAL